MNKKLTIGVAIIIVVVAYLFWSGMKDSSEYFQTVSEFFNQPEELIGKGTRVNGELVPGSMNFDAQNIILTFKLTDGEKELSVRYNGVAPDAFSEAVSIVVEGKYEDGLFNATNIMTKCPSKYEVELEEPPSKNTIN